MVAGGCRSTHYVKRGILLVFKKDVIYYYCSSYEKQYCDISEQYYLVLVVDATIGLADVLAKVLPLPSALCNLPEGEEIRIFPLLGKYVSSYDARKTGRLYISMRS